MLKNNKFNAIKNVLIFFIVMQSIQAIFFINNSSAVNIVETKREIRELEEKINQLNYRLKHDVRLHRSKAKDDLSGKLSGIANRIRELQVEERDKGYNHQQEIANLKRKKKQIILSSRDARNSETNDLENRIIQSINDCTNRKQALERLLIRAQAEQNRRNEELKRMRQEEIRMQQDSARQQRAREKREAEMRQRRQREAELERMRHEELRMQQDSARQQRARQQRESEMRHRRQRDAELKRMRQEELRMQQDSARQQKAREQREANQLNMRQRELKRQGQQELSRLRLTSITSKKNLMTKLTNFSSSEARKLRALDAQRAEYQTRYQRNPSDSYLAQKLNIINNQIRNLKNSFLQQNRALEQSIKNAYQRVERDENIRASEIIRKYARLGIHDLQSFYNNLENYRYPFNR